MMQQLVGQTEMVDVSLIVPGDNDRKAFDEESLTDLAFSIKENGLAQPITIRMVFVLPCGHRKSPVNQEEKLLWNCLLDHQSKSSVIRLDYLMGKEVFGGKPKATDSNVHFPKVNPITGKTLSNGCDYHVELDEPTNSESNSTVIRSIAGTGQSMQSENLNISYQLPALLAG